MNDRYIDWLKHKIDYNGRYHDHKETMAWLATAFYIAGIFSLAFVSRSEKFCTSGQWAVTVLLIGVGFFAFYFVWWQFGRKWMAGMKVAGCIQAMSFILPKVSEITSEEREFRKLEGVDLSSEGFEEQWPVFVATKIENMSNVTNRYVTSEKLTYFTMLLALAVAVVLIWWV